MKDKVLERLQELSLELEALLEQRQKHIKTLNQIDSRIKELSAIMPELQSIVEYTDKQ